tara:strand:- start:565 stop:1497 length:933 start_codon:yes stop_codon:yes gene_type:complete
MYSNILLLVKFYEDKLNNISGITPIKINIGFNRCMARLPDFKSFKSKEISDINKRCSRKSFCLGLCNLHLNKLNFGRVDEYPHEEMIVNYKKNNEKIEREIQIYHSEFYSYRNLKKKQNKNIDLIIRMSFDNLEYNSLEKFKDNKSKVSLDEMYENVIQTNKLDREFLTIDDKKKIIGNITKYSKKSSTNILSYLNTIDFNTLMSITVRDGDMNSSILFKVYFKDENYLINNERKIIGKFQNWTDEDDIVPIEYKTADNQVLHPITNLPILEIELNRASELWSNLNSGIYREYSYNEILDAFMITNNILN